jgi:hypothetical protein
MMPLHHRQFSSLKINANCSHLATVHDILLKCWNISKIIFNTRDGLIKL